MILTRLLIGKHWEAYKVLETSYFDKPLQAALRKLMTPKALEAESEHKTGVWQPEFDSLQREKSLCVPLLDQRIRKAISRRQQSGGPFPMRRKEHCFACQQAE